MAWCIKLFNGNISETYWRTSSDDVLRKYGYQYDDLNRMKDAVYQKPNAAWPVTHMYDESLTYDKNGNILSLNRNGDLDYDYSSTSAFQIDALTYTYDTQKKNQLLKVDDSSGVMLGFKDGDTGNDYSYDANGNMIRDHNKGIEIIKYNHLNLPLEIIFGTGNKIEYLYNAVGQKVRKTVTKDAVGTVTDYLDGFQYSDAKLSFFPHAEGYVKVTLCEECQQQYQVRFNYVYNYLDHLGNIRLSYGIDPKDEILKIMEENHYYPFGLKHTNYNGSKLILVEEEEDPRHSKLKQLPGGEQVEYKYKYNGKEYQDELGLNMYDYGARNYDPALGRWMNIDPLAEEGRRWSPYNYAMDNPVYFIDPDGMKAEASQTAMIYYDWDESRYIDKTDESRNASVDDALNSIYQEKGAKNGEVLNFNRSILDRFEKSGINPFQQVRQENPEAEIKKVIESVEGLEDYYVAAGSATYSFGGRSSESLRAFTQNNHTIYYNGAFSSYFLLASTIFHETTHVYQDKFFPTMDRREAEREAYSTEWRLADSSLRREYPTQYKSIWRNILRYQENYNPIPIPYPVKL